MLNMKGNNRWILQVAEDPQVEDNDYILRRSPMRIQDCSGYGEGFMVKEYQYDEDGNLKSMVDHGTRKTLGAAKFFAERLASKRTKGESHE